MSDLTSVPACLKTTSRSLHFQQCFLSPLPTLYHQLLTFSTLVFWRHISTIFLVFEYSSVATGTLICLQSILVLLSDSCLFLYGLAFPYWHGELHYTIYTSVHGPQHALSIFLLLWRLPFILSFVKHKF